MFPSLMKLFYSNINKQYKKQQEARNETIIIFHINASHVLPQLERNNITINRVMNCHHRMNNKIKEKARCAHTMHCSVCNSTKTTGQVKITVNRLKTLESL